MGSASSRSGSRTSIRCAQRVHARPDRHDLPPGSDCDAQWIYGDGSLWLYDTYNGSLARPHGELLRVSDATGTVVQRWAIPQNPRELLAVDADGLWFAPSVEGGEPLHTPASQMVRYESLYRVTPGAPAPVPVFKSRPAARSGWSPPATPSGSKPTVNGAAPHSGDSKDPTRHQPRTAGTRLTATRAQTSGKPHQPTQATPRSESTASQAPHTRHL